MNLRDFSESMFTVTDFTPLKLKIEALLYIMVPMASETMIMMILNVAKSQSDVNMKYKFFSLKGLHPETSSYVKSIALPGFILPIEVHYHECVANY